MNKQDILETAQDFLAEGFSPSDVMSNLIDMREEKYYQDVIDMMSSLSEDDVKMSTSEMMNYLIEYQICTEDEMTLVASINGTNEITMESILYVRTGYRNFEQLQDGGL